MRLNWDGFVNARDLGGIALVNGGQTSYGRVARSEHPAMLSHQGWQDAAGWGLRTVVSLETGGLDAEESLRQNRPVRAPDRSISVTRVAVEDGGDSEFVERWVSTGLWGTPLYFADALERWPTLHGDAIRAVAVSDAPVLIHCGRGHDRTGIIALILLAIAGAPAEAITQDYLLSSESLLGRDPHAVEQLKTSFVRAGTTALQAVRDAMDVLTPDYFRRAKVDERTIQQVRRLLSPS